MGPRTAGLAITSLLILVSPAGAAPGPYLAPAMTPDGVRVLPSPPKPRGPVAEADRRLFIETRKLQGSPRWAVATADVDNDPFERFACALGAKLSPDLAPAVARLLDRASAAGVVDAAKFHYRVPRPYLAGDAPICQARTQHLAENPDFPSGHAAGGWLEALLLAELAPDRATEVLARGRAYGESRVVCGAHSLSAVQAGWLAGAAANAALHGSPEFRADLDAARAELPSALAHAAKPDAQACAAEAAALADPLS